MIKKSTLISFLAVFIFIFLSDWVIHGVFLENTYNETAHLWRPKEEMCQYFVWMTLGQLILSYFFVLIFSYGYQGTGIKEGVRYGVLIAFLLSSKDLIFYAVQPFHLCMVLVWIGATFAQAIIAGIITTLLFDRYSTCCGGGSCSTEKSSS